MKTLTETIHNYNEHIEFINEHFLTITDKNKMKEYGDDVWDMLQKAYAYIGGVAGADSIDDIINDTDMWKLVRRNGKITAIKAYKFKKGGRKANCCASDGTEQGKKDLMKIYKEDGERVVSISRCSELPY